MNKGVPSRTEGEVDCSGAAHSYRRHRVCRSVVWLEKLQGETYVDLQKLVSWVCCSWVSLALRLGRGRAATSARFLPVTQGRAVQDKRETLMAACQVAGIGAAGLLLPCALIDMAFDTDFLTIAAQAMLAAFACALIVVVWTGQE